LHCGEADLRGFFVAAKHKGSRRLSAVGFRFDSFVGRVNLIVKLLWIGGQPKW